MLYILFFVMPVKIHSMATLGLECIPIEVEVDIARGLPKFFIVGLGDTAVQEARERVRSAIKNSGLTFPATRITINLAPADVKKVGPSFDLPMALGIALASNQIADEHNILETSLMIGELALDGKLRSVNGILPICTEAKRLGFTSIFLPAVNAKEASLLDGIDAYPVQNFLDIVRHLSGESLIAPLPPADIESFFTETVVSDDFAVIKGQEQTKRALEIAAAGGHNILMNGTPGSGKTLMARALRSILPRMTKEESLEVTKIYSVANMLPSKMPLVTIRPFRTIHHSASSVSLVGGGQTPSPGEISLAHHGVLFLDELAEFPAQVLEVLRQPLEDRKITISRVSGSACFPANFLLVAAMNPTKSGYDPHSDGTSFSIDPKYRKKLSGPLLDRIDLYTDVAPVKFEKLNSMEDGEPSEHIRARVQEARDIQTQRFSGQPVHSNAGMKVRDVKELCSIPPEAEELLKTAMRQFNLSARGFHRILKISRTIADLAREENIVTSHVAEALQYRPRF